VSEDEYFQVCDEVEEKKREVKKVLSSSWSPFLFLFVLDSFITFISRLDS